MDQTAVAGNNAAFDHWLAVMSSCSPYGLARRVALLLSMSALQLAPTRAVKAEEPTRIVCNTAGMLGPTIYRIQIDDDGWLMNTASQLLAGAGMGGLGKPRVELERPFSATMTVLSYSDLSIAAYVKGTVGSLPAGYLLFAIHRDTGRAEISLLKEAPHVTPNGIYWFMTADLLAGPDQGSCAKAQDKF